MSQISHGSSQSSGSHVPVALQRVQESQFSSPQHAWQTPAQQSRPAEQSAAQAPQLVGSSWRSTHSPSQQVRPTAQSPDTLAQQSPAAMQTPSQHFSVSESQQLAPQAIPAGVQAPCGSHSEHSGQSAELQHSAQYGAATVAVQQISSPSQVETHWPPMQVSHGSQTIGWQTPPTHGEQTSQSGRLGQQSDAEMQTPSQHFSSAVLQQVLSPVPQANSNDSQHVPVP
jgi:hypothetical protein